jgi:hypothetical protein
MSMPVVVERRADVAEPFYKARAENPLGIWRRRRFTFAPEGRELIDITDELVAAPPARAEISAAPDQIGVEEPFGILGHDALLADLERHQWVTCATSSRPSRVTKTRSSGTHCRARQPPPRRRSNTLPQILSLTRPRRAG